MHSSHSFPQFAPSPPLFRPFTPLHSDLPSLLIPISQIFYSLHGNSEPRFSVEIWRRPNTVCQTLFYQQRGCWHDANDVNHLIVLLQTIIIGSIAFPVAATIDLERTACLTVLFLYTIRWISRYDINFSSTCMELYRGLSLFIPLRGTHIRHWMINSEID